jgi:CarD family transcriptional regulator
LTLESIEPLKLSVGEAVVYGFHGVGRVAAISRSEAAGETIVLEFASGLRITLSVAQAQQTLRSVANESDLERVVQTLGEHESVNEPQWSKRFRATREKLVAGRVTGLAEVVRDGALREKRNALRSGGPQSPAERELYLRARRLLADEIGVVRGIGQLAADEWIAEQIAEPAA